MYVLVAFSLSALASLQHSCCRWHCPRHYLLVQSDLYKGQGPESSCSLERVDIWRGFPLDATIRRSLLPLTHNIHANMNKTRAITNRRIIVEPSLTQMTWAGKSSPGIMTPSPADTPLSHKVGKRPANRLRTATGPNWRKTPPTLSASPGSDTWPVTSRNWADMVWTADRTKPPMQICKGVTPINCIDQVGRAGPGDPNNEAEPLCTRGRTVRLMGHGALVHQWRLQPVRLAPTPVGQPVGFVLCGPVALPA